MCLGLATNLTSEILLLEARDAVLAKVGGIGVLISNAADNQKVKADPCDEPKQWSRLENFPFAVRNADIVNRPDRRFPLLGHLWPGED